MKAPEEEGGGAPNKPLEAESWGGRLRTHVKGHSQSFRGSYGEDDSDPFLEETRRKMARSQGRKRRRLDTLQALISDKRPVDELAVPHDHLRRSTRKRRPSLAVEDYDLSGKGFSSDEDVGLRRRRRATRRRVMAVEEVQEEEDDEDDVEEEEEEGHEYADQKATHTANGGVDNGAHAGVDEDEATPPPAQPRREGLRPRRAAMQPNGGLENGHGEEEEEESMSEDDEEEREVAGVGEEEEEEAEEGEEVEEGEEEEQRGRRYALRSRTEVQRFSPRREERSTRLRLRSPNKRGYLGAVGAGSGGAASKRGRGDGRRPRPGAHKRRHTLHADDSDDSLLVDELDKGLGPAWGRGVRLPDATWVPPGSEMPLTPGLGWGTTASGWGKQPETWQQEGGPQSGVAPQPVAAGGVTAPKAGADIQPVAVDPSVTFDSVGGLSHEIDALKEMVFFPLLYPDFFAKYHINPPRGVLLCGPPGTGKTLVARALASAASKAGERVTFYMRKGADVLSKWVGEAERQLKMLFEEAQKNQPSIIFFDEIDGLAPCRSSKQEQIHNSIVSTLLALMDGLDSRGQVVVLGATNRVDAIDSALRRPGRFDREFVFSLPNAEARAEILDIHTRKWQSPPSESLRKELADTCVGYCGADMKALCTEAAIRAFRRKYPQVYSSDEPYLIDVDAIKVERRHFLEAMSAITPAAHRSAVVHARPLSLLVAPCLANHLNSILQNLKETFPAFEPEEGVNEGEDFWESSEQEGGDEQQVVQLSRLLALSTGGSSVFVQRPRLLLCGKKGAGQDHLGPAILHELEQFPVHSIGLPSLLSDKSAKTPEEALVHILGEARRNTPAVLYLPHLQLWWDTADDPLRATLLMLLSDLPPALPLLLLATADVPCEDLDPEVRAIFGRHVHPVPSSTPAERALFFAPVLEAAVSGFRREAPRKREKVPVPELPKAPKVEKGPTEAELQAQAADEEHALRRLRMCLRDVCNRLLYEKRFSLFHLPPLEEDWPDYRQVVQRPMDVTTLLQNVDGGVYLTRAHFLSDVDLIASNAKDYFGDDPQAARHVSKAHALKDAVHSMLSQLDPNLVAQCEDIAARGGPVKAPGMKSFYSPGPALHGQRQLTLSATRASARLRGEKAKVSVHESPEQTGRGRVRRSGDLLKASVAGGVETVKQEGPSASAPQVGTPVEEAGAAPPPVIDVRSPDEGAGGAEVAGGERDGTAPGQDEEMAEAAPREVTGGDAGASQDEKAAGTGGQDEGPEAPRPPLPDINEPVAQNEGAESSKQAETRAQDAAEQANRKEAYRQNIAGFKEVLVQKTAHMSVEGLEAVYASLCRLVHAHRHEEDRRPLLSVLDAFVKDDSNLVEEEVVAVDNR